MKIRFNRLLVLLCVVLMPAVAMGFGDPVQLTKAFSPTTISDGGVTVLTFTFTSPVGIGGTLLTAFTDTLPSNLRVANTTVGGTCANAAAATTVTAGGTTVVVAALQVPGLGASCTVTVNVTNVAGQLNASCGTNPAAFTNSSTNISGTINLTSSGVTPSCVVVTAAVPTMPQWATILLAVAVAAAAGMALKRRRA